MKNTNVEEILILKHITKSFDEKQVVKGVNLTVFAGELLAVVGPSGSGKTTLLRLIAGLEKPDHGQIILDGSPLFDSNSPMINISPHRRNIGMVFQNYALWPHKTVFQNAAYPLQVRGVSKTQQREKVMQVLEQVHMTGFEKRYPHQLSSGEQQRIALARALVMQPGLLLLDEPLSNLDVHLRDEMGGEIKRIQQETNITIIYVTHDQVEAMTLSDRISVMSQGKIIQTGPPKAVYQEPKSKFVAGFLGVINLVSCPTLRIKNEKLILMPDGSTMNANHTDNNPSNRVTLAIRPENISLAKNGIGNPGTILDIAYQGNLIWYRLIYAGIEFRVQSTPDTNFEIGEEIWINIHHGTILP